MLHRTKTEYSKVTNKSLAIARFFAVAAMACFLTVAAAFAQNRNAGEIRGTVLDKSGAVIPGVAITIQNTATGVVTKIVSDSTGVYDAASVAPGTYSVAFEKRGFKTLVKSNIVLHVEAITVDAALEVGAVSQEVTVKAGAVLVQTETSDKREILTSDQVTELPNVGRVWYDYTGLLPGVNPGSGTVSGESVGINGQGANEYNFLIDGGTDTMYESQIPDYLAPPLEDIAEIDINSSNYSAEYGSGLAVFNVIRKSGTNKFHGSGFEFVQNDALEARNFFYPKTVPLRWNQYGLTFGGPIKRDKAFFFFGFQRNPTNTFTPTFYTFPSAAMREGDFSGLPPLYDPSTTQQLPNGTYARTAFASEAACNGVNCVPQSMFDPVAAKIQKYWPLPQTSAVYNNYFFSAPSPANTTYYDIRGDYNITSSNRLNASMMEVTPTYPTASPVCPIGCSPGLEHEWQGQVSEVWAISPNTVNEFRSAMNRAWGSWMPEDIGKNYPQQLGLPNLTANLFPSISIGGTAAPSGLGGSLHAALAFDAYAQSDTVTLIKGKHILKFGGEYDNTRENEAWGDWVAGDFSFSGIFTQNPASAAGTGLGYSDFLLGLPSSWGDSWSPEYGLRMRNLQAFAQDDFKVTTKLTLNIGLRWLAQGGWTDSRNRLDSFDPALLNPATNTPGAIWFAPRRAVGLCRRWFGISLCLA